MRSVGALGLSGDDMLTPKQYQERKRQRDEDETLGLFYAELDDECYEDMAFLGRDDEEEENGRGIGPFRNWGPGEDDW